MGIRITILLLGLSLATVVHAAGGPLGIDHKLPYDDSGIWARSNQKRLAEGVILAEIGGAVWNGGQTRLGKTFWRSIDATVFGELTVGTMKLAFGRERPSETDSPDQWFKGANHQSFPSGEVALQASFVTPFIAEYGHDHPWVWGLEALPAYDAVARMKTHGHWQTDVLAGWAIGTAWGYYAAGRDNPIVLSVMPHGIVIGWHTSW